MKLPDPLTPLDPLKWQVSVFKKSKFKMQWQKLSLTEENTFKRSVKFLRSLLTQEQTSLIGGGHYGQKMNNLRTV